MNSLQITYFLETAKHLNFSKAGEALYVSQSAVSRQIQRLEDELGITLFIRSTHGIKLTDTGKKMHTFLKKSKEEFDEIIKSGKEEKYSEIYIDVYEGGIEGTAYLLKRSEKYMKEHYPNIEVNITTRKHSELEEAIYGYRNHLTIAPQSMFEEKKNIVYFPLEKGQLNLVYSDSLFEEKDRDITLEDFSAKPFLSPDTMSASGAYRNTIQDRLESLGIHSRIKEMPNMDAITNSVIFGKGYSITGIVKNRFPNTPGLNYYPLDSYTYLYAGYHKDSIDIIKALCNFIGQPN